MKKLRKRLMSWLMVVAFVFSTFMPFINVYAAGSAIKNLRWDGTSVKWNLESSVDGYEVKLERSNNSSFSSSTVVYERHLFSYETFDKISEHLEPGYYYRYKIAPIVDGVQQEYENITKHVDVITNCSLNSTTKIASWDLYSGTAKYEIRVLESGSQVGSGKTRDGNVNTLNVAETINSHLDGSYSISVDAYADNDRTNLIARCESAPVTINIDEDAIHSITIQVEGDGTVNVSKPSGKINEETILTPTAGDGYHFLKWNFVSGYVYWAGHATDLEYQNPLTITYGDEDLVIKAIFEPETPTQHTVKFMDGSTELTSLRQLVNEGGYATDPTAPDKANHRFDGWYKDETYATPFDFTNTKIMAPTTIYAKYVEQVKITLELNGGTANLLIDDGIEDKGIIIYRNVAENFYKDTSAITPPTDKEFDYIEINGTKWTEDTYTVNNNITIKIIWKDKAATPTYTIEEGANQTYTIDSNVDVIIKASGDKANLTSIKVDGTVLDKANYDVVNGSTILTLKASYLNTLSEGDHSVEFVYNDGSVKTNLKVVKNSSTGGNTGGNTNPTNPSGNNTEGSTNNNSNSPQTSDNIMINIITLLLSLIGMAGGITYINRKKLFNR